MPRTLNPYTRSPSTVGARWLSHRMLGSSFAAGPIGVLQSTFPSASDRAVRYSVSSR
jgi:hypothetical protein